MIEVDGSHGEGGGQLLRNAVALSAVTGTDVQITNIRAGRPKPGLAAQHVTAIRAVAAIAAAKVDGLEVGSRKVTFMPGPLRGGRFAFDVGTAGSVTLVLQACLPAALCAPEPVELDLVGGTDVPWSPPLDYFRHVFLPLLAKMGGKVDIEVVRRGYFPRGGGQIGATVAPCGKFRPLLVESPGRLRRVSGISHVGNLPADIARRMKHAAARRLVTIEDIAIQDAVEPAMGPGGGIVLWTEHDSTVLGASGLAEKGVPAETVGRRAADEIVLELDAGTSLDVHAADQMLVYCALAKGESRFSAREVSSHAETTMWLLRDMLNVRCETDPDRARHQFRIASR